MNDIAISVRNLSKKYRLYDSPQHRLREALHPFRKKYHREFWALRDVSFEVKKGESIGIIGKNGSGKSTLLQLLCGTLEPTHGSVKMEGRVSALLELGAGFNPEFSGRENVYMNAALLGFTRQEIDERFDAIASFADIGEFIEQPVKTYSSGMYVRLAFATAINVDPDILVIDEALAVGDLRFQKTCKQKMNEFKDRGITIVLVSHAMSDISSMCRTAIFLSKGQPVFIGDVSGAINAYTYEENRSEMKEKADMDPLGESVSVAGCEIKPSNKTQSGELPTRYGGDKGGTRDIFISNVLCYQKGKDRNVPEIYFGENIIIEIDYDAVTRIEKPVFRINFSVSGYKFFSNIDSTDLGMRIPAIQGKGKVILEIKHPNLYPQSYKVNIGVVTETVSTHLFFWSEAASFLVKAPPDKCMSYPTAIIALDGEMRLV
jgi:ABC-type polysaccharide/polyol phosphate transport system ATPase subunit